jgi:hypothetical protein
MASSASTSTSYQAGGIPTWGNAVGGGSGNQEEADGVGSEWETRFGWRVDVEAAATYLLGPVSGWFELSLSLPDLLTHLLALDQLCLS